MEVDKKNTVSVKEIEEKVEEKKVEEKKEDAPHFPALSAQDMAVFTLSSNSFTLQTPLKNNWEKLMRPVVDQLKLLIRFNTKTMCVELKVMERRRDEE